MTIGAIILAIFLAILLGIALIELLTNMFGHYVRKAFEFVKALLEFIAAILRFAIYGGIGGLLFSSLINQIPNGLVQILVGFAVVVASWFLISLVCLHFRLIGYSVTFLSYSIALMFVFKLMLKDKAVMSFIIYLLILFFLPRIMWLNDRVSSVMVETDIKTKEKYGWFDHKRKTKTEIQYKIEDIDKWGDSEGTWKLLPLQIIFSLPCYFIGSIFVLGMYDIEPESMLWIYLISASLINLLFDLFVFRNTEETIVKALRRTREKLRGETEGVITMEEEYDYETNLSKITSYDDSRNPRGF